MEVKALLLEQKNNPLLLFNEIFGFVIQFIINECSSLKEIYLFNFNTSNKTHMRDMFSKCSLL